MKIFEGYITLDFDSAKVFHGIGIFCPFFALKDFLSYRPLKKVWADPPTAVRFRVKRINDTFCLKTVFMNKNLTFYSKYMINMMHQSVFSSFFT